MAEGLDFSLFFFFFSSLFSGLAAPFVPPLLSVPTGWVSVCMYVHNSRCLFFVNLRRVRRHSILLFFSYLPCSSLLLVLHVARM